MKKHIIIVMSCILYAGCYTTNKAKKQVSKAHALKPVVTAELCNGFYPVKDSIIKETIHVPGVSDTTFEIKIVSTTDTTYLDSIAYIRTTDTVFSTFKQYKESTSKTKHLNNEISILNKSNAKLEERVESTKKQRNKWRMFSISFILLYIGKVFLTKRII